MTYALSKFMRRMFFFASKSFRYSLSLSYRKPMLLHGRCCDNKLETYEFNLLDLLFQLSVFSLILDVLRTGGNARDMGLCLLLGCRGSKGYLVVHAVGL